MKRQRDNQISLALRRYVGAAATRIAFRLSRDILPLYIGGLSN
jgi:hypothetical protein